jgi:hypothetical protein
MLGVPWIVGTLVARRKYYSWAEAAVASFPHFWFLASLLLALIAFIFCSVSFYRRDFLIGSYALLGGISAFVYIYVVVRATPIY